MLGGQNISSSLPDTEVKTMTVSCVLSTLGFKLASLNRMIDTKSSTDRNMTLLHYIIQTLETKVSGRGSWWVWLSMVTCSWSDGGLVGLRMTRQGVCVSCLLQFIINSHSFLRC